MFPYKELKQQLVSDLTLVGGSGLPFVTADLSSEQVSSHYLEQSFYKKLSPNGDCKSADQAALDKFLLLNSSMSADKFIYNVESEQDALFWSYFKDNIRKALTPGDATFDLAFMRETFATGPGASLGHNNGSFYSKLFDGVITTQHPYLIALYRAMVSESSFWSDAERLRHKKFGFEIVSGNRLFFVPKNADISRTCCTEPGLELMFQKALGAFIELCLDKSFNITLDKQPDNNRELARIGSLQGTFGTMDQASASDSILWTLCQEIIPENLLGYMRIFRSVNATLPNGVEVPLRMVSTMGNGFTFPLQTLIFSCAVRSVSQLMGYPSSCPKTEFGVFGDDIIIRTQMYDFLSRCLTKLGFTVNTSKSFNTGPFRESCGHDWHNGRFVRGVYIRTLETASDIYSAINRLNRWSAISGVPLVNTIKFLLGRIQRKLYVPLSESDDSGYKVPFKLSFPKVDNAYWFSYRKLVRDLPKSKMPLTAEESTSFGHVHFNVHGWATTILGGFAKQPETSLTKVYDPLQERTSPDFIMMLRDVGSTRRFKVRRSSIPFWDYCGATSIYPNDSLRPYEPADKVVGYTCSFSVWENAVTINR